MTDVTVISNGYVLQNY